MRAQDASTLFTNPAGMTRLERSEFLLGMIFMPALAYKVSDSLSIGADLDAMYGYMRRQAAINNLDPRIGDGKLDLQDSTWGWRANLGIMYELSKRTHFGLRSLSQVDLNFKDTLEYHNLGPGLSRLLNGNGRLDLGMPVPTDLMFSAYHDIDECWAVMGNAGWQDRSKFGRVGVSVSQGNAEKAGTFELNTKDTWHVSAGLQNHSLADWILSAGLAYDRSMFEDADRLITIPVGETWRIESHI